MMIALLLFGPVLAAPAWIILSRTRRLTFIDFAAPLAAPLVWLSLAAFGVGAQSPSNFVELVGVVMAAVLLIYVRLVPLGRAVVSNRVASAAACLVPVALAVILRLTMPEIPI